MTPFDCLFCLGQVDPGEPRCSAFARAKVATHAGCRTARSEASTAPCGPQPPEAAA
jgi:hypothetical protein